MVIYLNLLVAIIGGLFYMMSANPKLQELGRITFFAGLLAFLIGMGSGHALTLMH